ncbi:MAG: hypothetical protein J6X07_07360 [Prevotella sp.]|jgi:hypothetical protein|nr:hypothetical protein [Prevotella sp.]
MKEEEMSHLRQQDQNLRDALRQEEAALPQMPADLNARLMQRMESEQPKQHRTLWRWMAAAACLLLLIGIGYTLLPQQQQDEPLVAQQSVKPQTEAPKAEQEPQAEPQQETVSPQVTEKAEKASAHVGQKVRTGRKKVQRAQQPQAIPETQEEATPETPERMPDMMPDPFLVAEMQAQQIRTRGMRLEREIKQQLNIKDRPL